MPISFCGLGFVTIINEIITYVCILLVDNLNYYVLTNEIIKAPIIFLMYSIKLSTKRQLFVTSPPTNLQ